MPAHRVLAAPGTCRDLPDGETPSQLCRHAALGGRQAVVSRQDLQVNAGATLHCRNVRSWRSRKVRTAFGVRLYSGILDHESGSRPSATRRDGAAHGSFPPCSSGQGLHRSAELLGASPSELRGSAVAAGPCGPRRCPGCSTWGATRSAPRPPSTTQVAPAPPGDARRASSGGSARANERCSPCGPWKP